MKWLPLFVLLTGAAPSLAEDNPNDDSVWIRDGLHLATSRFAQTTQIPHPQDKSLTAFNHESEHGWWGGLKFVNHTIDKVNWVAKLPPQYLERRGHYVLSARWVFLDSLNLWSIESFESTHQGNGSLWLLALEGRQLRVLLQTRAVDHHWGDDAGEVFRNKRLNVEYFASNPDEPVKVEPRGIVDTIGEGQKITSSRNVSEVWAWDKAQKVFVRSDR